jgi:quinol monooxygenase YgiN
MVRFTEQNETKCLSYYASEDPNDPLNFYIFEIYQDEEAWKVIHLASEPAKALFDPSTWQTLTTKMDVKISKDVGIGFTHRT